MNPEAYVEMAATEDRHWWFAGRRAILRRVLGDLVEERGQTGPQRILEVGSGTGGNLEMLASFGQVSAMEMDANARQLAQAKTGGRFEIRAGSCPDAIPFQGQQFDLICLFDVLEHIERDAQTLQCLRTLLAGDGRLVLTVPAYRWLWSGHDEMLHHVRRYSRSSLKEVISAAGFTEIRISFFNTLLFPLAVIVRLFAAITRSTAAGGARVPWAPINWILKVVFSLEATLATRFKLPFGVSLLAVIKSKG